MDHRKRAKRAVAAGVPATLLLAFGNPVAAAALPRPDYPSWDEVEQARASEAATAAKVEEIEGILIRLEAQAHELNVAALQAAELAHLATEALDAATARLDRLKRQAAAAQARAEESETRVAALVAQLARTGGGDVTVGLLLSSSDDADSLLARLGTADRLSASSRAMLDRALYDKKTAQALAQDARAAERERQRLADEAQSAFESVQEAADAARALADAQRADVDRMYAQLAALKGTTAEMERAYQEGITTVPTNPAPTPSTSPSTPPTAPSPTPSPSTPSTPPPVTPPPATSAVETAVAFATAQLGDRYVYGGSGPDAWDCSGLTKASYQAAGVYIGTHSATNQYTTMASQGRLVPNGSMARGDLLFYTTGNGTMYHVTMYLGGGKMIEAPNPSSVVRIVNVRYGDLAPYVGRPTG